MDIIKASDYIENSFLRNLLADKNITDISYNGREIFYLHNHFGRMRFEGRISFSDAKDFIRQIANLSEKQFSFQNPILDVSIGKYRVNAVHNCIARYGNEPCLTFAIRIAGDKGLITENSSMLTPELVSLFDVLLKSHTSMVISGITGSGKTEFQKFLISRMENNARLVIIDNVLELSNVSYESLDINSWQVDDRNNYASIQQLVKNALRTNPDWLIVAEARAEEMIDVLNSAMTGHPIITTLHALDVNSVPTRMGRMVMMNDKKMDFDTVMKDIYSHFKFFIYLKRQITSNHLVKRYISEIGEINEEGKMNTIYSFKDNVHHYFPIRKETLKFLDFDDQPLFKNTFVGK